MEKCRNHLNNVPYQLRKKGPTIKMKYNRLKHLKTPKGNKFVDNELCYYGQPVLRSTKKTY